jgi:hypothetical protein
MNARERILKAFNHEESDRIPTFCQSMMPIFEQQLEEMWGDSITDDDIVLFGGKNYTMFKKLGFDSAWGASGVYARSPEKVRDFNFPKLDDPEYFVDSNGRIERRTILNGLTYTWYVRGYLTTEELADEWYDHFFSDMWEVDPNSIKNTNAILKGYEKYDFVPTCGASGVCEPIYEGLGMALFGKLLRKNPSKIKKYVEMRTKNAVEVTKAQAETNFDVFNLCDDTAYKGRTMLNPEVHREIIVPAYKRIIAPLLKAGKQVFFHSDGFTEPYFPGLIEAGFTGVESLEPMAGMDLKHLKETYGDKLCLIGNMDVSVLLPYGSTQDVVKSVKKCIKDAGHGGGYILSPCTDLTNSCKVENVQAMLDAVKKFGRYPLKL